MITIMTSTSTAPPRLRAARTTALMTGFVILVFCTGTAEYLAAGLLPQVAADLGVSVAAAGQTVTAYALGVAVGGPIVTLATVRLPRKGLALSLVGVFVAGTALTALAPSYSALLAGRVIAASAQATLFAIGLIVATGSFGPGRTGRAIAIVSSGLTVATLLGVPLGAFMGAQLGWRGPFAVVAGLAIVGGGLIAATMPRTPAPSTGARDELRVLRRPPVILAIATTVVGFAGVGVVFAYLVPLLTGVTGIGPATIPALLLAYGIGGFAGNLVAGRLADRRLGTTVRAVFTALVVTLAAMPFAAAQPATAVAAVLLLGLLSTATIAPLQTLLLRHASTAPTLAMAVNVGAFNLANAIGASLGGVGVAAGMLQWNGLLGAALAAAGLILAGAALRGRPHRRRVPRGHRNVPN
jgi:DHA1 family inner membrane transport protein